MPKIKLGSTGIVVEKNGFGALPIQRISEDAAVKLLRRAYDGGMNFFDTSRAYTDSEAKISKAFKGMRHDVVIATKTMARNVEDFWKDLDTSLKTLGTDYIDIYQFHVPPQCYLPGDGTGMYEAMEQAKRDGKILHIGFTNHKWKLAEECILSGKFETIQYPLSYLTGETELNLVSLSAKAGMGYIAMKGMAGGLINNALAAGAFMAQFDNVVPIWGIQRESELDDFLAQIDTPPAMTEELEKVIEKDRGELVGDFCRSCGYCMPCPQNITINQCARISLMLRRAPSESWLDEKSQAMMAQVEKCTGCGLCKTRCPYGLDVPALLKKNLEDYKLVLAGKGSVK